MGTCVHVCWVVCVWYNYVCDYIIVQEWAKKYYDASTALKDRESMLDNVAEEIEKVSI